MEKLKEYDLIIFNQCIDDSKNEGYFAFKTFGNIAKNEGKKFAELLKSNACGDFVESLKNNL
ncbi:MAG: hypothetical protein ACTSRG_27075 [Candidatus Helarchaeota archaeon]